MDLLYKIFLDPFVQMGAAPDLLVQTLWEGLVGGVLYALIALGFVLIFKASGVFNFAQGIMVVFAALTLIGLYDILRGWGIRPADLAAYAALAATVVVMFGLAFAIERLVLRRLDIAAAVIALVMVATLGVIFQKTRIGRALRAVADSHKAALSVGISLEQIWVVVWFAAGIVALATGIMWGARSSVSFALEIIALKALPVLILGGFTSIPGAIVGGIIIGVGEKIGEFYWGPLLGSGIESWLAYVIALVFLLFRPQGLFGETIIERI